MSDNLTTYTVNLTERSWDALIAAAEQTGVNRVDAANRAMQAYALIIQAHNEGNSYAGLVWQDAPGKPCRIEVNRPWWRFW